MADKKTGVHEFVWRIKNFSACTTVAEYCFNSPAMRAVHLDDFSSWNLILAPRGSTEDSFISVGMRRSSNSPGRHTDLEIETEFCLIDVNERERFKTVFSDIFGQNVSKICLTYVRRSDIYEDKATLLPNDVLTLQCRARKSDLVQSCARRIILSTEIDVQRFTFLWKIRGLTRNAFSIKRVIHINSNGLPKGIELTCLGGDTEGVPNPLGQKYVLRLAIKPKDVPEVRIFMSATIQTRDSHRNPHNKIEGEHFFEAKSNDTWHLPCLDISDWMESILKGDILDLNCEFAISSGSIFTQTEETLIPLDKLYSKANTLQQDIRFLFQNDCNADVRLKTKSGSETYWAHKAILSARSLVFRQIFEEFNFEKIRRFYLKGIDANNPAIPSELGVSDDILTVSVMHGVDFVQVSRLSPQMLPHMLNCMYTDSLNPEHFMEAIEFYLTGFVLDFRLMREKSEFYLLSHISIKSFYYILLLAHSTMAVRLKKECLNFISENRELILASRFWNILNVHHGDLLLEISDIFESEGRVTRERFLWVQRI